MCAIVFTFAKSMESHVGAVMENLETHDLKDQSSMSLHLLYCLIGKKEERKIMEH